MEIALAEANALPEEFGPPVDAEEKAMVDGLCARDRETISDFLERTHRPVFAMACRLTNDADLRQDWTHDVLLRILEELAAGRFVYRWPGCFWSWFRKRSHFILLNLYRKQRTAEARQITGEEAESALASFPLAEGSDPRRIFEDLEIRATLDACLAKLPSEDHRTALHLLLLEELSYDEIAEAMEAPLNTVRSWIRRARIAVRGCLSLNYAPFGPTDGTA